MFQSFVVMLREGVEAALVIGIILVALERTRRKDLERPVWLGLGLAVAASIAAAVALTLFPVKEELYEGILYFVSAAFVLSMIWWVHRNSRTLRHTIEARVSSAAEATAAGASWKESWGLGAFAFLMVFREGAEAAMVLGAVTLTTQAMLSFVGTVVGLAASVLFGALFVRGSVKIDLRRFFAVTEAVLVIFVIQLLVNGYHEFSEIGLLPATQRSMALVEPVVKHNVIFILALTAIPLFVWLSRKREESAPELSGTKVNHPGARATARSR